MLPLGQFFSGFKYPLFQFLKSEVSKECGELTLTHEVIEEGARHFGKHLFFPSSSNVYECCVIVYSWYYLW